MKDVNNHVCDRTDDLVAFLYHELDEKDARSFELHVSECAGCERELASFGAVRESIVSWRDASLGTTWAPSSVNEDRQPVFETITRPSAFAAIQGFFNLSPLWLKGAAAFASVLFCVCAVLAIAYVKSQTSNVVSVPNNKVYSQAELDKQVAAAVQASEQKIRSNLEHGPNKGIATVDTQVPQKPLNRTLQNRQASYAVNTQNLRKPLTRRERRELAADLGLLTSRDQDELDLVTDKITQTP